jgi:hypothetical protein
MWSGHILFVVKESYTVRRRAGRPTVREGSAMSRPSIRYARPRAGDECFICPAAGVPGVGSWWALVVSTVDTLTEGTMQRRRAGAHLLRPAVRTAGAADGVSVRIALGWLFTLVLAFVLGCCHAYRGR